MVEEKKIDLVMDNFQEKVGMELERNEHPLDVLTLPVNLQPGPVIGKGKTRWEERFKKGEYIR